jgi:predicted amidohydrolase
MIVIGCQIETTQDIVKNLNKVLNIIDNEKFDLCVFPELHLTSYDFNYIESLENYIIEKSLNKIKNKIKENQIVVIGTVWDKYNSAAIISKEDILFYHKNTLTEEDAIFFKTGKDIKTIDFLGFKIGFIICRDQDNIALINSYKKKNLDILIQLSAHYYEPHIAIKKLDKNIAMAIVRAIDAGALFIKVNSVNYLNKKLSLGSSIIVNSKGLVLRQAVKNNEEIFNFNTSEIGWS